MTNNQLTDKDLRDEIVGTIQNMAAPGDWVRITKFISEIDATREDIREAFLELVASETIVLVSIANTKVITDQDRRDAIRVGDEDKHLVTVQL